jgi:hypothetical protein
MLKENPQSAPPSQVILYHLATGHYLSHALCLAARLGIADLLNDGPRHANELAEATRHPEGHIGQTTIPLVQEAWKITAFENVNLAEPPTKK